VSRGGFEGRQTSHASNLFLYSNFKFGNNRVGLGQPTFFDIELSQLEMSEILPLQFYYNDIDTQILHYAPPIYAN